MSSQSFDHWCILELMGHRKVGARVTEETIGGAALLRLEIPSDPPVTQYINASSIYCMTPTTEDIVRRFASRMTPTPVHEWELPKALPSGDGNPTREEMDRALSDLSDSDDDSEDL